MACLVLLHLFLLRLQLGMKFGAHRLQWYQCAHVSIMQVHASQVNPRMQRSIAGGSTVSFSMLSLTAGSTAPTVRSVNTPPIILLRQRIQDQGTIAPLLHFTQNGPCTTRNSDPVVNTDTQRDHSQERRRMCENAGRGNTRRRRDVM